MNMKYCTHCLYPETKPNLWFDETGKCSACIAFEARQGIDWAQREQEFRDRFPPGTRIAVACSGGKDSTYLVVRAKQLGLKPVAVCAVTDNLSRLGRQNLDNIGHLCDKIEVTLSSKLRNAMARHALETIGDISWCEHQTIWSVPARIAAGLGISAVLYGENPQNEYGAGPGQSAGAAGMDHGWEQEFGGLNGLRLADMMEATEGLFSISLADFDLYRPPAELFERVFFGHYFPWNGAANADIARQHGFRPYTAWVEGSACDYENLDNLQTGIHDWFRWLKFGYGRATDIMSNNLRRKYTTRVAALDIVRRWDGIYPYTYLGVPLETILAPLRLTIPKFEDIARKFTNRDLFDAGTMPPRRLFEVS